MPQNFCEITTLNVHVVPAKSTVEISQNLVAFSEYMNFTYLLKIVFQILFPIQIKICKKGILPCTHEEKCR
jgi:hypothetical protein